jgi:hypothetical protein
MTNASGVRPVFMRTVPHQKRMLRMNLTLNATATPVWLAE